MQRIKLIKSERDKLKVKQNNRCYYCNIKFDCNNNWKIPTVDHLQPFCQVWENTIKVLACMRCNKLKWEISEELYEDWYICVNFKIWFDLPSYNKAVKVRKPIKWYQKLFPSIFWRSKWNKNYKTTIKLY